MGRQVEPRQVMTTLPMDQRKRSFDEVARGFTPEAAIAEAKRCILCKKPNCVLKGCPLQNRIPEWIQLIQEGKFLEAAALTRTTSSMPEICSRVCPQERLCEGSCALGIKHEPVAIGALERFVNDYAREHGGLPLNPGPATNKSVAVIGAGPAGLAAAERLRWSGHEIVVYDALDKPGGMLAHAIPGFKLDPAIVEYRCGLLREAGVRFLGGWKLGQDISLEGFFEGLYDAVFVAVGTWMPVTPKLPGVETPGVVQSLDFLKPVERGKSLAGKTVTVLGGGDTAMDCARTAIRRGAAHVRVAYRRDKANMPGSKKEVRAAHDEGVEFEYLAAPLAFKPGPGGGLRAITLQRMELGEPDAKGRRSPKPVPGSEFETLSDLAVLAFGFQLDAQWAAEALGVELSPKGAILVNPETGATTRVGVFAGGDSVNGPDLVATAVVSGRRAAAGIHRFLMDGEWASIAPVSPHAQAVATPA